jgi:DNA-binding IclR family transcriptional regulator
MVRRSADDPSAGGVRVIARSAQILRILRTAPDGMTQAELGKQMGLARSTVHRLLSALRDEDLVETSGPRGRYRLGPVIPRMADAARRGGLDELHPLLEKLAREVNETVDLSVLERDRATFADQIPSSQRLRAVSGIGESFPLYCTASGKAFLASMSAAELSRALPGTLARLTPATITDRRALEAELDQVRAQGYALDREEHTEGICAAGVFLGRIAGVSAAVSILLPAQRFYVREQALVRALVDWAAGVRTRFEA